MAAYLLELKNVIFILSLNFVIHGTPQTAIRAAIRRSELTSTWKNWAILPRPGATSVFALES